MLRHVQLSTSLLSTALRRIVHSASSRVNFSSTSATTATTATSATTECSRFPGASTPFTHTLDLQAPQSKRPVYRVMNEQGQVLINHYQPTLNDQQVQDMYKQMITLHAMDQIFYDAQRQGRISFYMTNYGEEAIQIGSAAALTLDDVIFAQYREAGVLLHRGFGLPSFANQCFSNMHDLGKGRQMPVHYGSRALNLQTISSPLATQLPQATGAAYALKLDKKNNVVICYFGEGAASEGDFHAALNFAATLECPVIFFCRNNGFAISTPSSEQYRGDGIVSRAEGYGMHSIRVDGNDILAVHEVTSKARDFAIKNNKPVLIEAMSYRAGHHSTSDDSTRYRPTTEIQYWNDHDNPITRVRLYLESRGMWDSEKEMATREQARKEVLEAFNAAEAERKPPVSELFTDVYAELPPHLAEQKKQILEHLSKHHEHYSMSEYETDPETEQAIKKTL